MSVETERVYIFFQEESTEIKEEMVKDKSFKNTQIIAKKKGNQAFEKVDTILKMYVSRKSRVREAHFQERAGHRCH